MSLRILTANLYNGRARPDSFAAALDDFQPDVVAVQELSSNAAEILSDWGVSRLLDPSDETDGMGLAVKIKADMERLEFPNRNPVRARFDGSRWGLGRVEVVSAHLVNPVARPIRGSRQLRVEELDALERLMAEPFETRVVVGDFNSSPAWPLYKRIAAIATDGAAAAGTARRTWSYLPGAPRLLRIDHAFIQGAACRQTRLVNIRGADHRGLIVDVSPA